MANDSPTVAIGETVYDEDGEVRGFQEGAFVVSTGDGVEALSVEHERAGHEFGGAELVWRCSECGALGDVEAVPDACPDCGAPREYLYYWTED